MIRSSPSLKAAGKMWHESGSLKRVCQRCLRDSKATLSSRLRSLNVEDRIEPTFSMSEQHPVISRSRHLHRLHHLAGSNTSRTDIGPPGAGLRRDSDSLDIGHEKAFRLIVCVAYPIADHFCLSTDRTSCHTCLLPVYCREFIAEKNFFMITFRIQSFTT